MIVTLVVAVVSCVLVWLYFRWFQVDDLDL